MHALHQGARSRYKRPQDLECHVKSHLQEVYLSVAFVTIAHMKDGCTGTM